MTIVDSTVFKVRDSVDLFLTDGTYLLAYYMNSRKRRTFRVNEETVALLERIDGRRQVGLTHDSIHAIIGLSAPIERRPHGAQGDSTA